MQPKCLPAKGGYTNLKKNVIPKALSAKEHGLLPTTLGITTSKLVKNNVVLLFFFQKGFVKYTKTGGNSPKAVVIKLSWDGWMGGVAGEYFFKNEQLM